MSTQETRIIQQPIPSIPHQPSPATHAENPAVIKWVSTPPLSRVEMAPVTVSAGNNHDVHVTTTHDYGTLAAEPHVHGDDRRGSTTRLGTDSHASPPELTQGGRLKHILVIAACCVMVFPLFWIMAILGPAKSGIDCDNLSDIRHPHRESLTPTFVFTLITSLVAVFFLIITEFVMCRKCKDAPQHRMRFTVCRCWKFPSWVYFAARNLVAYAFGVHVTQGSVFLIRMMVAIPRPDWWTFCQPIFPNGTCPEHQYTTDYECRNQNQRQIWDASRSFPSGHVAFIVFNAVFLMIYLERRCRRPEQQHDSVRYFLRTVEFWLFVAVFFTSADRVHANSHHPSDVYVGALFGIAGAIFASRLLLLVPEIYQGYPGSDGRRGNHISELAEMHHHDVEAADKMPRRTTGII